VVYLREAGVEVADVTMNSGMDEIAHALDAAVVAGAFPATPGTVCATCAHRAVCAFAT
jgi:alcohol dehydrogenase class IV